MSGSKAFRSSAVPPGAEKLAPGIEYGIEIPKYEIVDGDFWGQGTAYWRGGDKFVSLSGPSAAHGGHPNSVGLSLGDRKRFDEDLRSNPGAISTVWSAPGVTALAMTDQTLQKLARYKDMPADYATVAGQKLPEDERWVPTHTIRQIFFDPRNRQISEDAARSLMRSHKQTP